MFLPSISDYTSGVKNALFCRCLKISCLNRCQN